MNLGVKQSSMFLLHVLQICVEQWDCWITTSFILMFTRTFQIVFKQTIFILHTNPVPPPTPPPTPPTPSLSTPQRE